MRDPADLKRLRGDIRAAYLAEENEVVRHCLDAARLTPEARARISAEAAELVRGIRRDRRPGMMESFLAEYGLTTREGVALMCLAEAMLRVPDTTTLDALIHDKITPSDWGRHLGRSSSSLVNASTWGLMLTGRLLDTEDQRGLVGSVRGLVRRMGEPVVRTAVGQAMKVLGQQFVLGRDIDEAMQRGSSMEERGYTYSFDMLGEAARTAPDAERYLDAYARAIDSIASHAIHPDIRRNPGISVKLSALYPRYEHGQKDRAVPALVERTVALARRAKAAAMGFNIDAEEADRLDISLDIIEQVLANPELDGWDGFGIVVQAYSRRCLPVLDWLGELARAKGRRIMVRLVKGAYWDAEIKRAQVLGLGDFPVFTRKVNTDISYLAGMRRLLELADRIYPQFATHNAHSATAGLHLAAEMGIGHDRFEFQRLHGMGEGLHDILHETRGTQCRIYAPVGVHEDLLAYLVRRLLENGANSSFVNQIVDESITPERIALDPVTALESRLALGAPVANPVIRPPSQLYAPDRRTAKGWDITDPATMAALDLLRDAFRGTQWHATPLLARGGTQGRVLPCRNPADPDNVVGSVRETSDEEVDAAVEAARLAFPDWSARAVEDRAALLERLADLLEENAPELFALMAREAGKTVLDAVGELREAVDFCRYYAAQARHLRQEQAASGRGVFVCISPWNFPLAIFTGQISAALVTGNTVLAKPAEQTPLVACRAVQLMHEAGIPRDVIQLLPGDGATVGARLTAQAGVDGVCFTGSIATARIIHRAMADNAPPDAPLIAETGGLNAMIVDSTALPEQAVRDIIASAFQSAGQRCSALRILYVQKDVEERTIEMLGGAMQTLRLGDPWALSTDVGPVIDAEARGEIEAYCARMEAEGQLIKKLEAPEQGLFVAPAAFRVAAIRELEREIFGPVLHVASFEADELLDTIAEINAAGYGLTFGLHTRIDERVQDAVENARVGNIYVNRNQIGAVVGTQPFGGEGLSGTGPKAGGPLYLRRFRKSGEEPALAVGTKPVVPHEAKPVDAESIEEALRAMSHAVWAKRSDRATVLRGAIGQEPRMEAAMATAWAADTDPIDLPGPTGESNRLWFFARGIVLCLGEIGAPDAADVALEQAIPALALGNAALLVAPGALPRIEALRASGVPIAAIDGTLTPDALRTAQGIAAVAARGDAGLLRPLRQALARREGPILPFVSDLRSPHIYLHERTVCVDTTAAGGNASLLAASGSDI